MKVKIILAISLTATSFSSLAFKSQLDRTPAPASEKVRALESNILANFYSQHGAEPQSTIIGTCDASPVQGCSCPFCSMLRSRIR